MRHPVVNGTGTIGDLPALRYKRYQAPLETLLALDKPAQYLCPGISVNTLKRIVGALSDTDAAVRMQRAKSKLFEQLNLTV